MGYKIDQSCEDKGITTDIRDAMTSAFEMANFAYALLTSDPVDEPDVLELVGFLFAKEGVDPAQLIRDGKLAKTLGVLGSINENMHTEVLDGATPDIKDVVRIHLS
jgi:hypothetical protein